jgi:NAD(P)-dependent dehydrogenase (short-subunit alcohol dehydrogenase family)
MEGLLTGKIALVTGASKGVGKGIALALARAGAEVFVNYHSDEKGAAKTVAEIAAFGGKAQAVNGNISSAESVKQMFDQVSHLDIMVNNGGVQTWKAFLDVEEKEWDHVIDTNLKGTFLCTQMAARKMKEQGGGRIINIGSGCNKFAFPRLVAYTASKGGIEQLTKVSAIELGKFQINVNCVAPGSIEVERTNEEDPNYAKTWGEITPLGRVGTPADIGNAVVFFASPMADFITGQTLWVDGGIFSKPQWPYPVD